MKIDTYHEAQDLLDKLKREALEAGNRDVAKGLDDLSERLKFCWSKTVEKEEEALEKED